MHYNKYMGRGDGSNDILQAGDSGTISRSKTNPWDRKRRTDEEVQARFEEVKEWESTPTEKKKLGTREHLESFITRLNGVDYEKARAANNSRIPDDNAEYYALRVLEDESKDYKVLWDIVVKHRFNEGFTNNPEEAPKADDYKDEEISVLSPEGVAKEERRKEREEQERWKEGLSLDEFKDLANKADWYYEFSDDGRAWRRGEAEVSRVKSIAKGHPEREKVLEEMSAKMPHASF